MASLALLRESGGELGERHLRLGAAVKVAQGGEAALELVLAEKNGGACTELVGALHAPRDIAMKAELDGDAGMAQIPRKAQRLRLGADRHDRHRPRRRRRVARQHGETLDAAGPADGGRRRAAHGLRESVIAPAREHSALSAQGRGGELEDGVAVIVEPAHDARIEVIGDAEGIEGALHLLEETARRLVEIIEEDRRPGNDALVALILGIEDAQGIAREPGAAVLGEAVAVLLEIVEKRPAIRGSARGIAQRVQLKHRLVEDTEILEDMGADGDYLDVAERVGNAKQLEVDLMELPVAPLLRTLIAEHRPRAEEFEREALTEATRDESAHDARRRLRTARELLAAAVGEGVHLLGDDVRGVAQGALEHLGELEDRDADLLVAVEGGDAARRLGYAMMPPALLGQ